MSVSGDADGGRTVNKAVSKVQCPTRFMAVDQQLPPFPHIHWRLVLSSREKAWFHVQKKFPQGEDSLQKEVAQMREREKRQDDNEIERLIGGKRKKEKKMRVKEKPGLTQQRTARNFET